MGTDWSSERMHMKDDVLTQFSCYLTAHGRFFLHSSQVNTMFVIPEYAYWLNRDSCCEINVTVRAGDLSICGFHQESRQHNQYSLRSSSSHLKAFVQHGSDESILFVSIEWNENLGCAARSETVWDLRSVYKTHSDKARPSCEFELWIQQSKVLPSPSAPSLPLPLVQRCSQPGRRCSFS